MQRKSTLSLFASLALLALVASAQEPPAVTVTGGKIQGGTLKGGGAVFKGIPFAAPPVGDLRWREPMPVKPWTAISHALTFATISDDVTKPSSRKKIVASTAVLISPTVANDSALSDTARRRHASAMRTRRLSSEVGSGMRPA